MHSLNLAGKLVGWEQRGKTTAAFQEDLKTKLTTLKSTNGPFPYGTAFLMDVLKREEVSFDDYLALSKEGKKVHETQADECLLACLFVKNCKQWGNESMEQNL